VSEVTTFVGMDVHKKKIAVALLAPGHRESVTWQLPNEPAAIRRLARRLLRESDGDLFACYEAGPTGYALQRQLRAAGVACQVVAPSLTPVKPGARIKTDRRDARKLAELLRADLLTEVHPPSESDEALRDLCRCREDVREDLTRARHRMSKFLLRRHCYYGAGKRAWLRCFRGIDTVTAVTLVAELHDFQRFPSPRALMAFLGLVPSEHSSGESQRRGPITKTGNRHVRRLLVEAAWHNRYRPAVGLPLRRRREGQPQRVIDLADRAAGRLHRRYVRLTARGKPTQKAVVAVARELAGFLWMTLHPEGLPAQIQE